MPRSSATRGSVASVIARSFSTAAAGLPASISDRASVRAVVTGAGCAYSGAANKRTSSASVAIRPRMTAALFQRVKTINVKSVPGLFASIGPAHVDAVHARGERQPEVHAEVVLREIAAAPANLLPLLDAAGDAPHPRANRIAIRRDAGELQRDPVVTRIALTAEEVRPIVDVRDRHIDLAVVVEIAERRAAPRLRRRDRRAEPLGDIDEASIAAVAIHDLALFVSRFRFHLAHFGIDVAVGEKEIEPAVIIEVDETGAPPEPARIQPDARGECPVVAEPGTGIRIQGRRVAGKIRLEDIHRPIAIE